MSTSINIKIFKQADIQALDTLMKLGHVFGLCPSKVNIQKKIDYSYILYVFLWLIAVTFLLTYVYNRTTSEVNLSSFNSAFSGGFLFINLTNVIMRKNEWNKLIDILIRADVSVTLFGFKLRTFYIKLAVLHIIWISFELQFLLSLKLRQVSSFTQHIIYVVYLYECYELFWTTLIVKHLLLVLETRYKMVKSTLKQVPTSPKDIKIIKEKIYNLHICTKYVNMIFGKPLLLLTMKIFWNSLNLFSDIIFFKGDDGMHYFQLFLSASQCFKNGVFLTLIVIHCEKIEEVYKNILFACNTLTTKVNDDFKSCLMDLMDFLKNMTPKFTTAGFFQLNQSVLSTFVSIVASYFVVIVQFKTAIRE